MISLRYKKLKAYASRKPLLNLAPPERYELPTPASWGVLTGTVSIKLNDLWRFSPTEPTCPGQRSHNQSENGAISTGGATDPFGGPMLRYQLRWLPIHALILMAPARVPARVAIAAAGGKAEAELRGHSNVRRCATACRRGRGPTVLGRGIGVHQPARRTRFSRRAGRELAREVDFSRLARPLTAGGNDPHLHGRKHGGVHNEADNRWSLRRRGRNRRILCPGRLDPSGRPVATARKPDDADTQAA